MASKLTELRLHLRPASTPLFGETGRPNTLTVRIAPDDPASPLGAARVERLSVLGDLLSSDRVDAVTH